MRDASASADADSVALIAARRQALAHLYARLAAEMGEIGQQQLETIFTSLAGEAGDTEAVAASVKAAGEADLQAASTADFPSPYAVWAFAVRNEVDVFEALANAAGRAEAAELQAAIEHQAQRALDRAARYRTERRIAFHAERVRAETGRFPDIRRIDTRADLVHVALAVERWLRAVLSATAGRSAAARPARQITDAEIARLKALAETCRPAKRLEQPLKRLATATGRIPRAALAPPVAIGRFLAESERVFDYYDDVFETAVDAEVLDEAQRLSITSLDRVRSIREAPTARRA